MAQGIVNQFLDYLFGPSAAPKVCEKCEMLQEQLAFANYDRKMLLEHILNSLTPKDLTEPIDLDQLAPIRNNKFIPWRVRQEQLQNDSKALAEQLRKSKADGSVREIDNLEKELGLKVEVGDAG